MACRPEVGETDLPRRRESVRLSRAAGRRTASALANLMDAELLAGNAQAAVRTGQRLMADLLTARDEYALVFARINLAAALRALDRPGDARPLLQDGLAQAATPRNTGFIR